MTNANLACSRAYEQIKKKIVHNELNPSRSLNEIQLAKELKLSRTPIREALIMLGKEQLITRYEEGRGFFTKHFSLQHVNDLYEFREIMETATAPLVIEKITDQNIEVLAVIDGIYTAERGPGFDGVMHRADLLAASWDVLSADLVGARLLGQDPAEVPHLAHAAARAGRPLDLADVEVVGLKVEEHCRPHQWTFPYNQECTLPLPMAKKGISGVSCYKYDTSICTYCSGLNGVVLAAIAMAWRGQPWDEVEVLTGKMMQPRPGARHTILLGKCMYQAHKDNPAIKHMLAVKGCPSDPAKVAQALHQAGIMVDPNIFLGMDRVPGMYMRRYQGNPEFDERHFQVQ